MIAILKSGIVLWLVISFSSTFGFADEPPLTRTYSNTLTPLKNPPPLLADYPEFVEPVRELKRFEAPILVDELDADLSVRAWRFSYNARGIVEMPNRLQAKATAVIMVHPWGIDDGQGWDTPEPAGVCDFCTPDKNHLAARHTHEVINPFLKQARGKVPLVMYSLPGGEDPIRKQLYRSLRAKPTDAERQQGAKELTAKLKNFEYKGQPLVETIALSKDQKLIFLVDGGTHRVHSIERETLEVLSTFGHRGRWAGEFESPHSIAIDSKGNLYIAETLDGRRIQRFLRKGMASGTNN